MCFVGEETSDLVFFHCEYFRAVFLTVLHGAHGWANVSKWQGWLDWVSKHLTCKQQKHQKLEFIVTINQIWKERNGRVHG